MTATAYGFLLRASTQRVTVPGDQRQTRPAAGLAVPAGEHSGLASRLSLVGTLGETRRDDEPLRSRARWPAMTSRPSIRPVTIACNYQSIDAFCPLAIKPFRDLPLKLG